jgi:energy-coupling factor transporter ATP-binding protein EcfA2
MLELSFDKRLANRFILESQYLQSERLLKAWQWKSSLGESFPLVISLMGGTGTGKSTLFNSLAGQIISKVGHRRPSTLRAVVLAPLDVARQLSDCPLLNSESQVNHGHSQKQIVTHQQPELSGSILVDTPDIDSVEISNRINAENFFIISDILIFVTSQEKYGDLTGHEMTERARLWGKKTVFIMNKVSSDIAYDDFRSALKARGFSDEPIRVERLPSSPEFIPELRNRPEFSVFLGDAAVRGLDGNVRAAELERLRAKTASSLETLERSFETELQRVTLINKKIRGILADVTRDMQGELDRVVTQDVETHIRERLHQLTVKYDILFVPRKKLREAVKQVIDDISAWFNFLSHEPSEGDTVGPQPMADLAAVQWAANLKPLETTVAKLNQQVAQMLTSDSALEDLCRVAQSEVPRWDSKRIHELYHDSFPGVEKLLETEFKRFQDGLPVSDRVKLYGWSGVWAAFVIAMEIVVGGGFTLLDALLNTAILPSIPTLVLKARVASLLRDIGERVDRAHRRTLNAILEKQAQAYIDTFAGLLPSSSKLQDLRELRQSIAGN